MSSPGAFGKLPTKTRHLVYTKTRHLASPKTLSVNRLIRQPIVTFPCASQIPLPHCDSARSLGEDTSAKANKRRIWYPVGCAGARMFGELRRYARGPSFRDRS